MYEFETSYTVDTGNLSLIYTGSGVHLNKDVSILFQVMDPMGNIIDNDFSLAKNQLVSYIAFDVLSSSGTLIYDNYKVGSTLMFSLSESENISLFGKYTKDFGVKAKVANNINSDIFSSEFYLYANVPEFNFSRISVVDGTKGYYYGNRKPVYDKIQFNLRYLNNLNYLNFDRIDIYASTSPLNSLGLQSGINIGGTDVKSHPSYIYSKPILTTLDATKLILEPNNLQYKTPYYFALVPYSKVGSGQAFYGGPYRFEKEQYFSGEVAVVANSVELAKGEDTMISNFGVTSLYDNSGIIDFVEKGVHATSSYIMQSTDPSGSVSVSDLRIIINNYSGYSGQLIDYNTTGSTGTFSPKYYIESDDNYVYLKATGMVNFPVNFKFYKTSI